VTNQHHGTENLPSGAGILARTDGASIAYHRTEGQGPGVVFLHGFHSDMTGSKALALEAFCRARGHAFLRWDGFGHGGSSGDVADGTIGRWVDDALAVLDTLTRGPQILVGSSLGGWLALLAALQRQTRVAGLVGIAAAPDFTEDLLWSQLPAAARQQMLATGETAIANAYDPDHPWRIKRALIEDGRNHLLLRDTVNLFCPIRLLHGQKDADVPWETALRLADCLAGGDVAVTLVKDGDHRLSRDGDIALLLRTVGALMEQKDPGRTA
jgi:pimeloyl-ACP methyl ester carboxylesterase